jgi:hypothetical protein
VCGVAVVSLRRRLLALPAVLQRPCGRDILQAIPGSCKGWVHFQGQGVQDYCWELILWPPGRFAELYFFLKKICFLL